MASLKFTKDFPQFGRIRAYNKTMNQFRLHHGLIFSLALTLGACSQDKPNEQTTTPKPSTTVVQIESSTPEPEPQPIAPVLKTLGKYTVDTARDCDGFPRLNLSTPEGLCVGLVASSDTPASDGGRGLIFPRDIVFPKAGHRFDSEIYVTDMGGWGEHCPLPYKMRQT